MKRYEVYSECLCGIGFDVKIEEDPQGRWVDAKEAESEIQRLKEIISTIYWQGPEMTWANFDDDFVDEVFEISCGDKL